MLWLQRLFQVLRRSPLRLSLLRSRRDLDQAALTFGTTHSPALMGCTSYSSIPCSCLPGWQSFQHRYGLRLNFHRHARQSNRPHLPHCSHLEASDFSDFFYFWRPQHPHPLEDRLWNRLPMQPAAPVMSVRLVREAITDFQLIGAFSKAISSPAFPAYVLCCHPASLFLAFECLWDLRVSIVRPASSVLNWLRRSGRLPGSVESFCLAVLLHRLNQCVSSILQLLGTCLAETASLSCHHPAEVRSHHCL